MNKIKKMAMVVLALAAAQVMAADYPTKPVRFVVAFPPGSAVDIVGRVYTQKWTEMWGQTALPDNRPGAGGSIAAAITARASHDGYTLLLHSSGHTINPALYAKLPFDTLRDFVEVGPLAQQPNVLITKPGSSYKSVRDLIAAAKARPDSINFASAGVGSGTHLNLEKFKLATQIKVNHIPFKGSGEVLPNVAAGRVDFYFAPISAVLGFLRGGKVQALAVSTIKRSSVLPDIPTVAESGVPGFDFSLWIGVWAPTGVPSAVINKLAASIKTAAADPGVHGKLSGLGNEPMEMTPAQFAKFVREEIKTNGMILKTAGVKPM